MFRCLIFTFIFVPFAATASARDEKSIKDFRDALVALAPDVDRGEAELLSVTAHTTSRALEHEYGAVGPPALQNFFVHVGLRRRGYCFHWARDIGVRLKELRLKTLVLYWGAAGAGTRHEHNCVVVCARRQPFRDGIIIDGWRYAGRLFWQPITEDSRYKWAEDVQETAWLQDYRPPKQTRGANAHR
jgi:hypothetical protein